MPVQAKPLYVSRSLPTAWAEYKSQEAAVRDMIDTRRGWARVDQASLARIANSLEEIASTLGTLTIYLAPENPKTEHPSLSENAEAEPNTTNPLDSNHNSASIDSFLTWVRQETIRWESKDRNALLTSLDDFFHTTKPDHFPMILESQSLEDLLSYHSILPGLGTRRINRWLKEYLS